MYSSKVSQPTDALGERGAGDVLDALHQRHEPLAIASRHGAKPTPQLPITTVVTPWIEAGMRSSSHETWPS
jgi:hypothetical protein